MHATDAISGIGPAPHTTSTLMYSMHITPRRGRARTVALQVLLAIALIAFVYVARAQPTATTAPAASSTQRPSLTDAMNDSIVTVDELVKKENATAIVKARQDAEASGLVKPDTTERDRATKAAAAIVPPATFVVTSIAGFEDDLRARVIYNGTTIDRAQVGTRIGSCIVSAIEPKNVKLKGISKGVPVSQCPLGVWTGVSSFEPGLQAVFDPSRLGNRGAAGSSMPSPVVGVSAPRPYSSVDPTSLAGRPMIPSSQPLVQLVPGAPAQPGQTSVPLVPRQMTPARDPRPATAPSEENSAN